MKKIITMILALTLVLSITGCSNDEGTVDQGGETTPETVVVGILQPMEHVALTSAKDGFMDAISEASEELEAANITIEYEYQNALGVDADLKQMASTIVRKADITLAIGTGAAQTMLSTAQNSGNSNPILFTAVTDPVGAGLVNSLETPGANVTGTHDQNPVNEQIELIIEVLPEVDSIGVLYTASEQNSEVQANQVTEIIEQKGLNHIVKTINNASEIQMMVRDLAKDVDAIYIPTDNLLASNMSLVGQIANEEGVLIVTGDGGMVESGGHITLGLNYYELGYNTGKMAVEVLLGEDTANMEVTGLGLESCDIYINQNNLDAIGVTLPESLK